MAMGAVHGRNQSGKIRLKLQSAALVNYRKNGSSGQYKFIK
jgi:hypothetical protein